MNDKEIERTIDEIDSKIIKYRKASEITIELIADKTCKLVLDAKIRETLRLLKELQMIEHLTEQKYEWMNELYQQAKKQ